MTPSREYGPPNPITMKSKDRNVEAVREKLLRRSEIGLNKYGTTTERDDIDRLGWLLHLQEELLDACVYIEALLSKNK